MLLLSVDPGVRGCGVGLFFESRLAAAAYVVNPVKRGQDASAALQMACAVACWYADNGPQMPRGCETRVAIECPRVYKAAHQKGDQNTSIIPLTLVVGAVVGRFNWPTTQFFPRDWKGTVDPDEVMIPRIKERLSAVEHARVQLPDAEDLAHNVWDGVGVGLKLLGRLEPRRVFHREP